MHRSNIYYGHDHILAWYCGLRCPRPMFGILQHGWTQADTMSLPSPLRGRVPVLAWSDRDRLKIPVGWDVTLIGAPFLYLLDLLVVSDPGLASPAAAGTLAYPQHHSPIETHEHFARRLERLCDPAETRVVLHWNEYQDASIRSIYERRNMTTLSVWNGSAQPRHDPLRLLHHVRIMRSARHLISNSVSTSVWYGAHLGLRTSVYASSHQSNSLLEDRWAVMNGESNDYDHAAVQLLASGELGAPHVRTSTELRALLGWTSAGKQAASMVGQIVSEALWQATKRGIRPKAKNSCRRSDK